MRLVAAVGVVAILLAAVPARAETVVGVLAVRGDGDVPAVAVDRFADAIEEGLAGGRDVTAASRTRMQEMLADSAWSPACTIGPCLAEVRAQTGATLVVVAGLAGSGQSYRFTITLADTEAGRVVAQVTETCAACTVDDVASSATIATIALMNGTGETRIMAPPVTGDPAALERAIARRATWVRRTGVLLLGAALLGAGASYYFLDRGEDDVGYPLAGAAAGLTVSGTVLLGLSLRF